MRTLKRIFTISTMAFLFMLMVPHKSMAQDYGYVSNQEFYDNLQNYGTWVQDDEYGNVWVPDVDGDFRPYATNGYWVQTEYGTTWVSDYPWGWATFHYGRWRYDDYYGWEWIPGHEWAPAWVSWRHGGGYYGWAPMQPGITISISIGGGGGYHVPDNYWVCAPQAYITSRNINRYYVQNTRTVNIIHNTTIINNTYINNNQTYIAGPRPQEIQRVTHRPVTVYRINNASQPGAARVGSHQINIYRPAIKAQPDARPARVVNAVAYKQAHPNAAIGSRGTAVNIHTNAARLAAVARTNHPGIVHINPAPNRPAATNNANAPQGAPTHQDLPGGHRNVGTVNPATQDHQNNAAAQRHNVAPAVMPPADHHNPAARQPQQNQVQQQAEQKARQAQQQARQVQQQASEQAQKQAQQQTGQAQQVRQQAQQRAQQAQQQTQQKTQQAQQQARQQQEQAQQRVQQLAQQKSEQQQQAQQQRAQQQAQQQSRQQQQQAQQQAQQRAQQQQQQAQQQAQQRAQQAQRAQQQAQQRAQQRAQQQAQQRAQQQQQKQQQEQPQKQNPPGN